MGYDIIDIPFATSTLSLVVNDPIPTESDWPTWATGGSDGIPPSTSPAAVVTGGFDALFVTWTAITNTDPVTYDIHISTSNGFTPNSGNLYGTTQGTIISVNSLPGGGLLTVGTTYYVVLVARDVDGAGPNGTQGSGMVTGVSTGSITSDGVPPSSSPTPVVIGGPTFLSVAWTPTTNHDPVTYDVHLSTSTGFTASGGNLYASISGTSIVINELVGGGALSYGITYFVVIVSRDVDGSAAQGTQGSGAMVQIQTTDITPNAITTPLINAGAVVAGSIAANTITAAQIAANTITAGQIQAATITTNEIAAGTIQAGNIAANTITSSQIATGQIEADSLAAVLVLGSLIQTASSGQRVEIDTNGIRLYDGLGNLIVNLSSQTGTASFAGEVTASAFQVEGFGSIGASSSILQIQPGGTINLAGGQPDPSNAPSIGGGYAQIANLNKNVDGNTVIGSRISHAISGSYFGTVDTTNGTTYNCYAVQWNPATGAITNHIGLVTGATLQVTGYGAAVVGSNLTAFYLNRNASAGNQFVLKNISTSGWTLSSGPTVFTLQPGASNFDPSSLGVICVGGDGVNPYLFSYSNTGVPHIIKCTMSGGQATGAETINGLPSGVVMGSANYGNAGNLGDTGGPVNITGAAYDGTYWYLIYSWNTSSSIFEGRLMQVYNVGGGAVVAKDEIFWNFASGYDIGGGGLGWDGTQLVAAAGGGLGAVIALPLTNALTWDYTAGNIMYAGYTWVDDLTPYGSGVTISNASPAIVTEAAHGLTANKEVFFTTTGALPTGLTVDVIYYVVGASITTNTFEVSATSGGSAINTSSAGSGTHTLHVYTHSGMSPIASINFASGITAAPLQRQTITLTTLGLPSLANEIWVYTKFASSTPSAAALLLQSAPTYTSSNTASPITLYGYNPSGPVNADSNVSTFQSGGGTGSITGAGTDVGSSWYLDSSGVTRLPTRTSAQRTVTKGDIAFNTDTGVAEYYDGNGNMLLPAAHDSEDLYDKLQVEAVLQGSYTSLTGYPFAYTVDPETCSAQTTQPNRLSAGVFMVKKSFTCTGAMIFVTTAGTSTLTGFQSLSLWSIDSIIGAMTFIVDTGSSSINAGLNTLGLNRQPWTATTLLIPDTLYAVAFQSGTYAGTQQQIAACNPGLVINMGLGPPYWRSGGKSSVTTRQNSQILSGSQALFSVLPWIGLY